MAVITPDTYVKLVRLDVTKEHQLTFSSLQAQTDFFNNLSGLVLSDFTYQKKDNVIRYPALYETIEKYNYLLYRNEAQSNKTYYCYITDMKYINDEMTEIRIETDVFQTWQFDIIYKEMFVEREHTNNDTIGNNTVPEGIDTGEFICNDISQMAGFTAQDLVIVVQVTTWCQDTAIEPNPPTDPPFLTNYGGIPMAGGAYLFDYDHWSAFKDCIKSYTELNPSDPNYGQLGEAVYNIYTIPKMFIANELDETTPVYRFMGQEFPLEHSFNINKPTTLNNYTPINNKLFTYPYCYLVLSNNNGSSNILHYEKFKTSDCQFKIKGVPTVGGSIKCNPKDYGAYNLNEEEGIICGKYPALSWAQNEYYNWLNQNARNLNNQTVAGVITSTLGLAGIVGAIATGNLLVGLGAGATTLTGLTQVAGAMDTNMEHKLLPNSAQGNVNAGDINVSSGSNGFFFYRYSIKEEFARRIDKYFSMFGYKTNLVKLPNVEGRTNWNFVKTIDCNIEGTEIPEKDINILKEMFNTGITFWHNYSTFRDYSQSNNIVI